MKRTIMPKIFSEAIRFEGKRAELQAAATEEFSVHNVGNCLKEANEETSGAITIKAEDDMEDEPAFPTKTRP